MKYYLTPLLLLFITIISSLQCMQDSPVEKIPSERALIAACTTSNVSQAQSLLKSDLHVNYVNEHGDTPLKAALKSGAHPCIIRRLLSHPSMCVKPADLKLAQETLSALYTGIKRDGDLKENFLNVSITQHSNSKINCRMLITHLSLYTHHGLISKHGIVGVHGCPLEIATYIATFLDHEKHDKNSSN